MNSQSFHRISSITTSGVSYGNSNAVSICLNGNTYSDEAYEHTITIFDLPTELADAVNDLFSGKAILNEDEIRADERRKIAVRTELEVLS